MCPVLSFRDAVALLDGTSTLTAVLGKGSSLVLLGLGRRPRAFGEYLVSRLVVRELADLAEELAFADSRSRRTRPDEAFLHALRCGRVGGADPDAPRTPFSPR